MIITTPVCDFTVPLPAEMMRGVQGSEAEFERMTSAVSATPTLVRGEGSPRGECSPCDSPQSCVASPVAFEGQRDSALTIAVLTLLFWPRALGAALLSGALRAALLSREALLSPIAMVACGAGLRATLPSGAALAACASTLFVTLSLQSVLVIPVAMAWSAFGPAFPIYYTCGFFAATHALSLLVAFSAAHLLVSAVAAAVEMVCHA